MEKPLCLSMLLVACTAMPSAYASSPGELCKVLRTFVKSVRPDESASFTYYTSWGQNFKDDPTPVIGAKRCAPDEHHQSKVVCEYLMEHGSMEFPGSIVKNALNCLSRGTRLPVALELREGAFYFSYGTDDRGALIDITLGKDEKMGGMALRFEAQGY